MEISKALQEEILTVQNKLKNAIRDHQICVGKLKDDPNNPEILGQIQQIQLHIVSLGRCQKQVVQRLRKEVEAFKAENAANGVKVSIASLLGFNNNNHITNNNEKKIKEEKENDVVPNGLDCRPTKEDYEDEVVRNGDDCPSPQEDIKIKERSSSVETVSYEDEIVEISTEERTPEKKPDVKEISLECASKAQLAFLNVLELITTSKYSELQSKRAERKRRSTANPQFVYSSLELPTKRKRYSYLQSAGNAPQTRQTTARLNGPSPPLAGNASGKVSSVSSKSSTSPPAKNLTSKSLIATQKSTIRPNILRNAMESKVYSDISKSRNETNNQIPSAKSVQNVGNKAVHIPGLPSSLTIERVESDAAVCIRCRKPGHLSICENCTTNFHVSCYPGSTENPSSKLCPKCSSSTSKTKEQDDLLSCKKEEEDIVATAYASRITGEAREDTKVYKTACGFYKVDAAAKRSSFVASALNINQLPSSTFLIPITTKNVHASNAGFGNVNSHVRQQDNNRGEYEQQKKPQWQQKQRHQCDKSDLCYNFTYKPTDYSKKPKHNSEKQQQSYLIVQKVRGGGGVTKVESVTYQQQQQQQHQQQQQRLSEKSRCKGGNISIRKSPVFVATGNAAIGRRFNKQQQQQQPANRIILPKKPPGAASSAERAFNGRKARILRQPRKHGIENIGKEGHGNSHVGRNGSADEKKDNEPRKYRAKFSLLHSLFASYNKPDLVADDYKQSEVDNEREREDQSDNESHRDGNHAAKSEEHVKLEEAHLSAPFGTKLVDQGEDQIVRGENELEENIDDRRDDDSELKDDNMEFLKHEREYYALVVGGEREGSCDRQSQDCEVVSSRRNATEISVPHENQDLEREGMESRICQTSVRSEV